MRENRYIAEDKIDGYVCFQAHMVVVSKAVYNMVKSHFEMEVLPDSQKKFYWVGVIEFLAFHLCLLSAQL